VVTELKLSGVCEAKYSPRSCAEDSRTQAWGWSNRELTSSTHRDNMDTKDDVTTSKTL